MKSSSSVLRYPNLPAGVLLFGWVRLRQSLAGALGLLREPVKCAVIVVAWACLLAGAYALIYRGMLFVFETAGLGLFILNRLWFLFLFVLVILLAASQLANAYSSLVRAPETRSWMTLPVSARTLCRVKWLESSVYSTWAVLVLAIPMCLAYCVLLEKPIWLVLAVVGGLFLPLTGLVTALATALLLVWLRWFSRIAVRREFIAVGLVLAAAGLFWVLGERGSEQQQDVWFVALQALLPRMKIAMSMWVPSSWAAFALDAWVSGRWLEGLRYAALLWTTMLVAWRILDHVSAGILLSVLRQDTGLREVSSRKAPVGRYVSMPWWANSPLRAALLKDALMVIRDPLQWSQFIVFFGLLGAYFGNIHRFAQFSGDPSWRIGIASLNLACTLLVFGSLSVRFAFPQLSLEGRRLWLLRIVPKGMQWIMAAKLCLYGALGVFIISGLSLLSVNRLGVPLGMQWWLAGSGVCAALALVGLSVGLGALWIDPQAQDAARVVSSSQGALALVLMLGYVGCVVAALLVAWGGWLAHSPYRLLFASIALAAVSLIAGVLPVKKGLARLERLEAAV